MIAAAMIHGASRDTAHRLARIEMLHAIPGQVLGHRRGAAAFDPAELVEQRKCQACHQCNRHRATDEEDRLPAEETE